jgi:uncharacterized Zn-binding protein involved in type VI secretion
MSRGVARVGIDNAGGVQLGGGQSWFRVDGALVVVHDDPVAPHGIGFHGNPRMVAGAPWLRISGKAIVAEGDLATCGHPTTGSSWFGIP